MQGSWFLLPWLIFVPSATILPRGSDAFAYNLVGSRSGCMTELATSEVIMNNRVVSASESDFPEMRLVVLHDVEERSIIEVQHNHTMPFLAWIKLSNPYPELENIQYVLETMSTSPNNNCE